MTVIFDLDGVLVESEPFWRQGFAGAVNARLDASRSRHPHVTPEAMTAYQGGRVNDTLREVLRSVGDADADDAVTISALTDQVVERVSSAFREDPQIIESSLAVARALHDRGTRLAIASSSSPRFIEAALDVAGVSDAFEVSVSALYLEHAKPHPQVYLEAAAALGEKPADCVAIEDSGRGIGAAVAAGIPCVGLWQGDGPAPAEFAACDLVTTDLTTDDVDTLLRGR